MLKGRVWRAVVDGQPLDALWQNKPPADIVAAYREIFDTTDVHLECAELGPWHPVGICRDT